MSFLLQELFFCDGIQCQAIPVSGYDDIRRAYLRVVHGSPEVRSVFLINCGSSADLSALFTECDKRRYRERRRDASMLLLQADEDMMDEEDMADEKDDDDDDGGGGEPTRTFYVLDSHRPIHLYNMFDNLSHGSHWSRKVVMLGHRDDCSEDVIHRAKTLAYSRACSIYHEGTTEHPTARHGFNGSDVTSGDMKTTSAANWSGRDQQESGAGGGEIGAHGHEVEDEDEEDELGGYDDDDHLDDDLDGFIDYSDERDIMFFGEDGMPRVHCKGAANNADDEYDDDGDGNPMEFVLSDDPNLETYRRFFRSRPEERDNYRALIQYYKKEYHVIPSALLLYKAITGGSQHSLTMHTSLSGRSAVVLDRDRRNKMLWWAIIGMTDHFVNERMTSEDYRRYAKNVANEVLLSNSQQRLEVIMDNGVAIPVTSINTDQGIVVVEKDLRLMLYRHWNLYDSLFHTSFMAARLNTWREQGRENVHLLLASIGIPLDEAHQHWRNMTKEYRDKVIQNLSNIVQGRQSILMRQNFNPARLADIFYSTFHKRIGTLELSAEDMVHCVMAIMDSPAEISGAEDRKDPTTAANSGHYMSWKNNFDKALMALGGDIRRISQGIHNAIHIQRALVQEVSNIMESRGRSNNAHFRLTSLVSTAISFECLTEGDDDSTMHTMDGAYSSNVSSSGVQKGSRQYRQIHLFLSPLALRRLTLFIRETLEMRNTKTSRPLVLSMTDPISKRVIVVGVSTDRARNKFGMAFRLAHERLGSCQMKHVGFGMSMVELESSMDLSEFLSILTYILSTQATIS